MLPARSVTTHCKNGDKAMWCQTLSPTAPRPKGCAGSIVVSKAATPHNATLLEPRRYSLCHPFSRQMQFAKQAEMNGPNKKSIHRSEEHTSELKSLMRI